MLTGLWSARWCVCSRARSGSTPTAATAATPQCCLLLQKVATTKVLVSISSVLSLKAKLCHVKHKTFQRQNISLQCLFPCNLLWLDCLNIYRKNALQPKTETMVEVPQLTVHASKAQLMMCGHVGWSWMDKSPNPHQLEGFSLLEDVSQPSKHYTMSEITQSGIVTVF